MAAKPTPTSPNLSELPRDELIVYGQSLGLQLPLDTEKGEALRLVRRRQELLVELDREAMLDAVRWLRMPVRRTAGKEHLAQLIARHQPVRFDGLSNRGLHLLAMLSDVEPCAGESRPALERRLRKEGGWSARLRKLRRRAVGSFVSRLVSQAQAGESEYRYLPEVDSQSIRKDIEDIGVVGGVARKLRGMADDYVHEKLDEIERRIDAKLDEIDQRLGEWRDREVVHRLRMLKITLLFSILVVIISLVYDYLKA